MKACSKCKDLLPLTAYDKGRPECKRCGRKNKQTANALVRRSYTSQQQSSVKRGHPPPAYTYPELLDWCVSQPEFHDLMEVWAAEGHDTDHRPSLDRIDDYKPYTFDNIQLSTVKENRDRYIHDVKAGINTKQCSEVEQLDLEGNYIATHHSYHAAALAVGKKDASPIQKVAAGIRKTAYGFRWRNPLS